jgi:uncharacterized protein
MAQNPVRWFEIYVEDMNRAKKFYESVFKVKLEKLSSPGMLMWCFPMEMRKTGSSGALVKMKGACSGGNSIIIYFACKDCAVEEALAVKNGGILHKKKTSIGEYGFISLVHDTEGNLIGLHSM